MPPGRGPYELNVWTFAEWAALAEADRPAEAQPLPGLGCCEQHYAPDFVPPPDPWPFGGNGDG
jgi:hypothetical protein